MPLARSGELGCQLRTAGSGVPQRCRWLRPDPCNVSSDVKNLLLCAQCAYGEAAESLPDDLLERGRELLRDAKVELPPFSEPSRGSDSAVLGVVGAGGVRAEIGAGFGPQHYPGHTGSMTPFWDKFPKGVLAVQGAEKVPRRGREAESERVDQGACDHPDALSLPRNVCSSGASALRSWSVVCGAFTSDPCLQDILPGKCERRLGHGPARSFACHVALTGRHPR